ncbi:hypothetical protein Tco_1194622 [Tanacetum coccineum]
MERKERKGRGGGERREWEWGGAVGGNGGRGWEDGKREGKGSQRGRGGMGRWGRESSYDGGKGIQWRIGRERGGVAVGKGQRKGV